MIEEERMKMIMDHYENPRNFGVLNTPSVVIRGGNPYCGDAINIYIDIGDRNIIENIGFDGKGCIISQAATSLLTEHVKGRTVGDVEQLDSDYLRDIVGKEMLITRPKCSRLALEMLVSWARGFQGGKSI